MQSNYFSGFKIINPISLSPNFARILLLSTTLPSGSGYTKIYSTGDAFAAVKVDGSITAWGDPNSGGLTPTSD
jgi:hypothetical protein